MKIYKVTLDMTLVLSRLREFDLKEFNSLKPIVFIDADNPDDACFKSHYKLASVILAQDPNMATQMKDILADITITNIVVPT